MNKRFYTIRDAEFIALESVLDYVMFHPNFLKWDTEQQIAEIEKALPKNANCFKLAYRSKYLDFYNEGYIYISRRLKDILSEYNLCAQYYNIKIAERKDISNFKWYYLLKLMRFDWYYYHWIDFKRSTFAYNASILKENYIYVDINSYDDVKKWRAQPDHQYGPFIKLRDIVLTNLFNPELDMFHLPFTTDIFVSERLKNRLEQEGITGIGFNEWPCKLILSE